MMRWEQMAGNTQTSAATKHDTQSLRLEVMNQANRLIHVERTLTSMGEAVSGLDTKLDSVITAVGTLTTRQELARPTDWMKVLGAALGAITIFTASVSGITYIVKAFGEGERIAVRKDIDFLQQRIDRGWGIGDGMSMRVREGK